jgi:FkbM family methyltransferase
MNSPHKLTGDLHAIADPEVERLGEERMALVFDVGMHNGDDTAYYLSRGFSVVSIEASPLLAKTGLQRFHSEVKSGRLTILEIAIAECSGEQDFWICEDLDEWSSLSRNLTARAGKSHHSIRVPTLPFRDILACHSQPFYIKVDIEGSDPLCIHALDETTSPQFISVETECSADASLQHRTQYLEILCLLRDRGYSLFKLVEQSFLTPIYSSTFDSFFSRDYRIAMRTQIERQCAWKFPFGSSGPFGDDIPGEWMRFSEAADLYSEFRARVLNISRSDIVKSLWCDWHAKRV